MSQKPVKAPVIADVARAAGVSVPTVSRVLTGAARVSEDKRARVQLAIDELGFRPSATARALVAGSAKLISVMAGNTSRYGYAETVRGIEEAARAAGYTVTITVVETAEPQTVAAAVASVTSQSVAGVIVLQFDAAGVAAMQHLPTDLPVVAVSGTRPPGRPQAKLNDGAAAKRLVEHLLNLGHHTVHHVAVPHSGREDHRTTGWRRALKQRGALVPPVLQSSWEPESGRRIGLELADRPEVTAVFCGNDEIAIGLMRGVQESGRTVPQDISVVGFDDHPLAAYWSPPLTTVNQDFAAMGASAYSLLAEQLTQRAAARVTSLEAQLIIRGTTSAPPQRS